VGKKEVEKKPLLLVIHIPKIAGRDTTVKHFDNAATQVYKWCMSFSSTSIISIIITGTYRGVFA
jgi:hypothetical protein